MAVVRHRARGGAVHPALRPVLAVAALALAGAAGIVALAVTQQRAHPAAETTWITPVTYTVTGEETAGTPPSRLRIPSLRVDTALESLTIGADGVLASPVDYGRAGWFAGGTSPGDVGPAVIAGHVDSRTGPAVFFRLRELTPGATVEVERDGRWVTFVVTHSGQYTKDDFPTGQVYGPTPAAELRLITCGGSFDAAAHSYRDNIVVWAVLAQ